MYPKTFEEACTKQSYDAAKILPDVSMFPVHHQAAITNYAKLVIISEAINAVDEFRPDWNDRDQYKWYPWFDMEVDDNNPSGFRFGDSLTRLRTRLAVPGFASRHQKQQSTRANNFWICGVI